MFEWCKSDLVHFDYAGLSNRVIAERRDPYMVEPQTDPAIRRLVGDRYVSTYTYGPLGLIMRTAELSDSDPTNNRNHYYLSDVMGGNMGLYMDDDGDPDTERQAVFQQFDAFGNDMSKPLSSTSSFAWRGQEGSVTDRASEAEQDARTAERRFSRAVRRSVGIAASVCVLAVVIVAWGGWQCMTRGVEHVEILARLEANRTTMADRHTFRIPVTYVQAARGHGNGSDGQPETQPARQPGGRA